MRHHHRLTIYNHKGGVGKTTLSVNIGAALAGQGLRVLLIDSDPQCNLTSFFLPDAEVDEILDKSEKPTGRTIWSALKPVADGMGRVRRVKPYDLHVDNLFLVPGDIRLSGFEQQLGDSWADSFKRRVAGLRATTALSDLVSDLVEEHAIDVVMYDTGPNIGPLNRVIVLDSDHIVVPVACDLFSVRALSTLGQSLKTWILDCRTVAALAPTNEEMLLGMPRFMGYIPQQFRVYGQEMAQTPSYYLRKVQKQIGSDVVNVLRKIDAALVPSSNIDPKLGQVKNFSTLVQEAQLEGTPLWDVSGGNAAHKTQAKAAFEEIASNIRIALQATKKPRRKLRPAE